ncbi:MAG: stage II sporulation protein M [Nanoarchaeota archaeon]
MKKNILSRSNKSSSFVKRFFVSYGRSWSFLVESKNYFLFILFLFFFSSFIGVVYPHFFSDQIQVYLTSLFDQVKDFGFWRLFLFIINNNVSSAFWSFFAGLAFGFFPIFVSVANGYVLGFVAGKTVSLAGPSVLLRLLPHGIFELPAIFISSSLGVRVGFSFFTHDGRKNFKHIFIQSVLVFLRFVIPLLIVAGLIEAGLIILTK